MKHLMLCISLEQHFTFAGQRISFHSCKLEIMIHSEQCRVFLFIASRTETSLIQCWFSLMGNERRRGKKKTRPGVHSGSCDCISIVGTHLEGEEDEKNEVIVKLH